MGNEEAVFSGPDYWVLTVGGVRSRAQRSVSTPWILRSQLLPLAEQVRRHDWARRPAAEGPGAGGNPRDAPQKVVSAPARREVVRWRCGRGLTERWAVQVRGRSASSLRDRPAPDRNADRRNISTPLAARHPQDGAGMISLKLRQQGARSITNGETDSIRRPSCSCGAAPASRCPWVRVSRWYGLTRRTKSGPWLAWLTAVRKAGASRV